MVKIKKNSLFNSSNSKDKKENSTSIKEQIKINLEKLNKTEILFSIDKSEVSNDFRVIAKQVQDNLNKSGGIIIRKGFGDIQIGDRLNSAGRYLKTIAEKTAIWAVPAIIEKGIKIGEHLNHKGRNYSTFTFAGKIIISDKPGIMAVVIKKTTGNFYKVHRVLTPEGRNLEI